MREIWASQLDHISSSANIELNDGCRGVTMAIFQKPIQIVVPFMAKKKRDMNFCKRTKNSVQNSIATILVNFKFIIIGTGKVMDAFIQVMTSSFCLISF